jgi:hypothetical protein
MEYSLHFISRFRYFTQVSVFVFLFSQSFTATENKTRTATETSFFELAAAVKPSFLVYCIAAGN